MKYHDDRYDAEPPRKTVEIRFTPSLRERYRVEGILESIPGSDLNDIPPFVAIFVGQCLIQRL